MTYKNVKLLITAGRYEREDMYNKLDLFFAVGRISSGEYIELTGLIGPEKLAVVEEEIKLEESGPEESET